MSEEREVLDLEVVIVGGGPGGLAAAYRLQTLINQHNEKVAAGELEGPDLSEAMIAVLRDLEQGRLNPVSQWTVPDPRLYLRKDYHPRDIVELYKKIDEGLIRRYVEHGAARVRLIGG